MRVASLKGTQLSESFLQQTNCNQLTTTNCNQAPNHKLQDINFAIGTAQLFAQVATIEIPKLQLFKKRRLQVTQYAGNNNCNYAQPTNQSHHRILARIKQVRVSEVTISLQETNKSSLGVKKILQIYNYN